MLLDVHQEHGKLSYSYFDSNGDVAIKEFHFENPLSWSETSRSQPNRSTTFQNWNGKAVTQMPTRFLNKFDLLEFIWKMKPEDRDEIFNDNLPKVYFVDIEVEVTDGFPEPEQAPNMVTLISIVNQKNDVVVLGLKPLADLTIKNIEQNINDHFSEQGEKFKFVYKRFGTEFELLSAFVRLAATFPIMTGWNFEFFDWTYIYNRCEKLGVNLSPISPIGKINRTIPVHCGIVDYAKMFDKYDRSIDVKENNTLDFVSKEVLGIKKIEYGGTLQELYEEDFERYVYYGAVDSVLVYFIDKKRKILELLLTLANITQVSLYKAFSPVAVTEALLSKGYWDRGRVVARKTGKPNIREFEGAYVKHPVKGFHSAIACFDFASLYPSVMREMNMSPESYVQKISESRVEEYRAQHPEHITTVSGAIYEKEDSVLKQILSDLYAKRRTYKDRYLEIQKELDVLESELKTV